MATKDTIWVKPANARAGVVRWEPDTEHPRNEAWIAGDALATSLDDIPATEVGRTAAVDKLLRDGVIIEVSPTARDHEIAKNTPAFPAGGTAGPAAPLAVPAGTAPSRTTAQAVKDGA